MDTLEKLQNETTQEMTNTVIARVNEMKQNVEIQKNDDIETMEKLNGVVETHYGNGQLESRATYKDGRRNGLVETWHDNGQLWSRAIYRDGVMIYKQRN